MKIGIISDTHSHLEPSVMEHFKACDELWHAGDIGTMEVLRQLEDFKPTIAVYGNIDGHEIRAATPENQFIEREGVKILMTHIAASPPRYNPRVRELIQHHQPAMLVCGHSHILKVMPDKVNNLLFVNPGAAGKHGFHKIKTLLRLELQEGKIKNLEVIEMGPRGRIS